jgi:chromosomal replication initiation ATPase DnaA
MSNPSKPNEQQIPLNLFHFPSHSGDDFMISDCNKSAVDLVQLWPNWPAHGAIIVGAPASGKSHLAAIWAEKAGAITIKAEALSNLLEKTMATNKSVVVENIQKLNDEQSLFHLYNFCREEGHDILCTSTILAKNLELTLADLRSRLLCLPVCEIGPPDEILLKTIMAKQFADRQILVEPNVINFLVNRMERSFQTAKNLVKALDKASLSHKRRITKPLAKTVLESL